MKREKKEETLTCRNITTISGTKGDGEVRVLNSREWHEVVYARGIPSASSFFLPLLSFYCEEVRSEDRRRGKRARRRDRAGADRGEGGRCTHNGRSSGRLKCSGGTELRSCVGQRLALKLKLLAKTYGERSTSGGREEKNGRRGEEVGSVGL